jgi:hypothetical protein
MLPYDLLLGFALLYAYAKSIEWKLPFYAAAVLFAITVTFVTPLVTALYMPTISQVLPEIIIKSLAGLPIFYLLQKYQNTVAAWLAIFAVGFIVLVVILSN